MRRVLTVLALSMVVACSADTFSGATDSGVDANPADVGVDDVTTHVDSGGGDVVVPPTPAWKPVALPSGPATDLLSVWGSGFNDVWVVGTGGYIAHWNGSIFETTVSSGVSVGPSDLRGVWGRGGANNDVLAVGANGAVFRNTGGGTLWTLIAGGAASAKDLVAVSGSAGTFFLQSRQGQQFSFDPPTDVTPKDISGQLPGNPAYACNGMHARRVVCNGGVVLDPISIQDWHRDNLGAPDLYGVWFTGSELAVVGAGGNAGLAIGSGALSLQQATTQDLHGVWVSADRKQAFTVGNAGTILRGDVAGNTGFASMTSGTNKNLRAVFGVKDAQSQLHVFAVGEGGIVLRLDL